jgi:hypothetical protein
MRYRDQNGDDWADIIDFLTMYADARRQPRVRSGAMEATGSEGTLSSTDVHRIE